MPLRSREALEKKIKAARAAYEEWRRTPLEERMRQVKKGLERFLATAEEVARDVTLQMGKPIREARREVQTFRERAEYTIGIAERSLAPTFCPPRKAFISGSSTFLWGRPQHCRMELPALIPVNVIVPALLAGNTVLLKHSAKTRWSESTWRGPLESSTRPTSSRASS